MPELPEVETVRRTLEKEVLGKTIKEVVLYRAKNVSTDPGEFVSSLKGKTILSLGRKGKWLRFHLSEDLVILSHLRMEGKYFFYATPSPIGKHDILRFDFTDGTSLVYNDTRKFGRLGLYSETTYMLAPSYKELGPEPWDIDVKTFHLGLSQKKGPAKEALLDQTLMCGLGNIYADETLFASHIHPLYPASKLDGAEAETLLTNARRILKEALFEGGSTIRSYHPGLGIDGKMQSKLLVYGRKDEDCPLCGHKLFKIEVGGRGTTYCPKCQHRPDYPYVLAVTGPIHSGKSTVAHYFESKGFRLFNADEVAKGAYLDSAARAKVIAAFGERSYKGKKPNIPFLRKAIATSNENKLLINSIIHPYVFHKAEEFILSQDKKQPVLLDVPLLVDAGMEALCDDILLVESSLEKRIERLQALGQDEKKMVEINKGYPLLKTEKKATYVLKNDDSIEVLFEKLDQILKDISRG